MGCTHIGRQLPGLAVHQCTPHDALPRRIGEERRPRLRLRINMRCMIENFLRSVWKRGGLAGATPEDAFQVQVGLGNTMTSDDILEGILRITVLVAVTHPAEFIEITFQQQMQKS